MSIESKNHHASDVAVAQVSQASRNMARPSEQIRGREFPSLVEERNWIVSRKQEIELSLSTVYSKNAYAQAQMKILGNGSNGNTLTAWLKMRNLLDTEKAKICVEKTEIDKRLIQVKGLMMAEAAAARPGGGSEEGWQTRKHYIINDMADELSDVRRLLERLVKKLGA